VLDVHGARRREVAMNERIHHDLSHGNVRMIDERWLNASRQTQGL
jgi:hypothetical protein